MRINKNILFVTIFITITGIFSFLAYKPVDVLIGGPNFPQVEYFVEELDVISEQLGIKVEYKTFSDIETYLIENSDHNLDLH